MTLRKGFPSKLSGSAADADDVRYDLAGTIIRDSSGVPRSGLFSPVSATLLAATGTWNVSVAAFSGAATRDGGSILLANDGAANALVSGAPGSNQRLDVIYAKQNDTSATVTVPDANNLPIFGVLAGVPSATPVRNPSGLPAGALELGTILVPSTATATNSAGVVITPTFQYTCMSGGVLPFPTKALMTAYVTAVDGQLAYPIDSGQVCAYVATATTPGWYHLGGRPTLDVVTFAGIYSSSGTSPVKVVTLAGRASLEGIVISTSATFVSGTTYTLGTIPAALAPLTPQAFACSANATALGAVQVDASGNVTMVLNSGFTGLLALSLGGSWRLKGL